MLKVFQSWNYEFHTDIITCITCWQQVIHVIDNSSVIWMLSLQIDDCWCALNQRGFSDMSITSLNLSGSHIWCKDQLYSWGQLIWFTGVDQTEHGTDFGPNQLARHHNLSYALSTFYINWFVVYMYCSIETNAHKTTLAQSNLPLRIN